MKKQGISEAMMQDMARFYLRELFYNIPEIPVNYGKTEDISESAAGEFHLEKGDGYCEYADEFINAAGYRHRYRLLWEGYPEFGGIDEGGDYSYTDPLNHPKVFILIRRRQGASARTLVSTLLHELLHYYCWYTGLDHHDGSGDFEDKCRELGLHSNYRDWKWEDGEWKDIFDYSKMDKYIRMYLDYVAEKAVLERFDELRTA